jgi:hypothetical protein
MSTGEGSHVRRDLLPEVVLHGTWLYAGEILCDVQIIHTNFRPGSGDYKDPPEIEEDQYGDNHSRNRGNI